MPATDYVSAISVHICRSVVPGHAGGHVPGRSGAYENQALPRSRINFRLRLPGSKWEPSNFMVGISLLMFDKYLGGGPIVLVTLC